MKRRKRNALDERDVGIGVGTGLALMGVAIAASVALKKPALALAGVLLGVVTTGAMLDAADARPA